MQFLVIISMVKIGGNLIYHQIILAITFGKHMKFYHTFMSPNRNHLRYVPAEYAILFM